MGVSGANIGRNGEIGGINCNMSDGECSYVHAVLQCLLMHPIMYQCQNEFNSIKNNNKNRFLLTKELYKIYDTIRFGKTANSSNFIHLFQNIFNQNKNAFNNMDIYSIKTPGKFLYFLLSLLDFELNNSPNDFDTRLVTNISLAQKKDENYLINLYLNYFIRNRSGSIIFKYFFSNEKSQYVCPKCDKYYDCELKSIFVMKLNEINEYRRKINKNALNYNLNLGECFDYYCNNNIERCKHCNEYNIMRYAKINNGRTLIIRLKRNNNGSKCDVDFPIVFNFRKFAENLSLKMNYILKACVSYGSFQDYGWKYFADINFDVNINSNGRWRRFIDSQSYILESWRQIYEYEPQILIYQLSDLEENNNNFINNGQNMNNNNSYGVNGVGNVSNFWFSNSSQNQGYATNFSDNTNGSNNQNNLSNQNNNLNQNNGNNGINFISPNQNVNNSFNNNNNINNYNPNPMFTNQGNNNGMNNQNSPQNNNLQLNGQFN